jgi:hypothetical protein
MTENVLYCGDNLDNFMKKIESIASATWGIEKSRSTNIDSDNQAKTELNNPQRKVEG